MIRIREGVNLLERLADLGLTSYRLRQRGIFGERTIQKLREGKLPSWGELDTICDLLNCQPGDLIEYNRIDSGGGGE